jgi:hypothetical protein
MKEFKSGTPNTMHSGAQQKLPPSLLPGLRMPSPRAETVYQAATVAAVLLVLMSV